MKIQKAVRDAITSLGQMPTAALLPNGSTTLQSFPNIAMAYKPFSIPFYTPFPYGCSMCNQYPSPY